MRNTLLTVAILHREAGIRQPATTGTGRHRPTVPRHLRRSWWMRMLPRRDGK